MHLNTMQASILLHRLQERIKIYRDVEVVLAPSMMLLQPLSMQIDRRKFRLAAQNAYHKDNGAYTGEVSFTMLRDLVHYCIIGHSERRNIFHESLEDTSLKVAAALRNGIMPIICIGETQTERLAGHTRHIVHDQLSAALKNVASEDMQQVAIAYEPVWAISSGSDFKNHKTVNPDDLKKIIKQIRQYVNELYGEAASKNVRILYGGSINSENVNTYIEVQGVDGFLVGGASINYHDFSSVVDKSYVFLQSQKQDNEGEKG